MDILLARNLDYVDVENILKNAGATIKEEPRSLNDLTELLSLPGPFASIIGQFCEREASILFSPLCIWVTTFTA